MDIYRALDYDDVLVVPKLSSGVNSKNNVNLSVKLKSLELDIPIIASPMKGIISPELIVKLSHLGGIGILHRFYDNVDEWVLDITTVASNTKNKNFGISVGLNWNKEIDIINFAIEMGVKVICVDVANGYIESLRDSIVQLRDYVDERKCKTLIMTGNVATLDGANSLFESGADLIRVGIGSGQQCTTRLNTGIGVPQITALLNCNNGFGRIICDGGIRGPADIVKSLVAGAEAVMIGSSFARCFESANNGMIYGMASQRLVDEYYHHSPIGSKSIEGKESRVEKDISLDDLLVKYWLPNIRSAGTYIGAETVDQFREKGKFVRVK